MKIKRKVEMNLPQLIEWAWENPKRHETRGFIDDTREFDSEIYVQEHNGFISIQGEFNRFDTFTVEVEEEITEDTVIPRLVTRNTSGGYNEWGNDCVNGFNLEYIKAIHILNDDLSLTLIWTHEKGLVE